MLDPRVRVFQADGLASSERAGRLFLGALEPLQARIDAFPPRAHEVDEEREIVHACVALGEHFALEPLESADRLVQESANLGDVPRDWQNFRAQAVPNGATDLNGDRCLELGRCDSERLDLAP